MSTLAQTLQQYGVPTEGLSPAILERQAESLTPETFRTVLEHLDHIYMNNPSSRISVITIASILILHRRVDLKPRASEGLIQDSTTDDLHRHSSQSKSSGLADSAIDLVKVIPTSSFFSQSLLPSLLLDQSPELFLLQVRFLTYLLPFTPAEIAGGGHVPTLLVILTRAVAWLRPGRKANRYFARYTSKAPTHASSQLAKSSDKNAREVDPERSPSSSRSTGGPANYQRRNRSGTITGPPISRHQEDLYLLENSPPSEAHAAGMGLEEYMARRAREEAMDAVNRDSDEDEDVGDVSFDSSSSFAGLGESPESETSSGYFSRRERRTSGQGAGSYEPRGSSGMRTHLSPLPELGWKTLQPSNTGTPRGLDVATRKYLCEVIAPQTGSVSVKDSSSPIHDIVLHLLRDLYAFWPSNLLEFARDPARYLETRQIKCPYSVQHGWSEVFDNKAILGPRMAKLFGEFLFNPLLLFYSVDDELRDLERFQKADPAETIASAHLLYRPADDTTALKLSLEDTSTPTGHSEIPQEGNRSEETAGASLPQSKASGSGHVSPQEEERQSRSALGAMTVSSRPIGVSINNSGLSSRPINIGGQSSSQPTNPATNLTENLKRDNTTLATELTHTRRLADMYLRHVRRLHSEAVAAASVESERQALYNWLKEQKANVTAANARLQALQQENARMKERTNQWNEENRAKLREFREEKRNWTNEASKSRAEIEEKTRIVELQRSELAVVKEDNFKLKNRLTEAEPKIRHIADYEAQIELLKDNQRLWESDLRKMADMEKALARLTSGWKQMEHLIVHTNKERQEVAKELLSSQQRIQELEDDLRLSERKTDQITMEMPSDKNPESLLRQIESLTNTLAGLTDRMKIMEEQKLEADSKCEALSFELQNLRNPPTTSLLT